MKMFGGGIVKRKAQRISGNTQLVIHCFFIKKKKKCLETMLFVIFFSLEMFNPYIFMWLGILSPPKSPKITTCS